MANRRLQAALAVLDVMAERSGVFEMRDFRSEDLDVADRTIRRALADLEAAGWVDRQSSRLWSAGPKIDALREGGSA